MMLKVIQAERPQLGSEAAAAATLAESQRRQTPVEVT